jgi:dihydroorotase-like cyclic amidohydrolase
MAAMAVAADRADEAPPQSDPEDLVPVEMEGDGPLLVREKFHAAVPMSIDQALFEMELVGHDFFLFTDEKTHQPSVVYKRRGYQYGVIRLVEDPAAQPAEVGHEGVSERSLPASALANGQIRRAADIMGR